MINYVALIYTIIYLFNLFVFYTFLQLLNNKNQYISVNINKFIFFYFFFLFSGLPPFSIFFFKVCILKNFLQYNYIISILLLILNTYTIYWYYINFYNFFILTNANKKNNKTAVYCVKHVWYFYIVLFTNIIFNFNYIFFITYILV